MIRVIAGSAKGARLYRVPGKGTRPIGDKVKESLFNILGDQVVEARFLDLYAGTGSVGIEALSRGCEQAVFVESAGRAVDTIHANLEIAKVASRARIEHRDVFLWMKGNPGAFDIVFLAPPQFKDLWAPTIEALDLRPALLNPDALVVAQMDPKEYRKLKLRNLQEFDERKYGRTLLVFYEFTSS